ncbi:MAG: GTP 3',8-cyclase MoaA [bacterium]
MTEKADMPGNVALRDNHDRTITYLRVSVTDRCNMRCVYCMPENATFIPHEEILRYNEIERLVSVGVGVGIRKVRVTGGEPLARKNVEYLVGRLAEMSGLEEVSLTTNGLALAENAASLAKSGVRRVNVSLDTLKPERFKAICRAGDVGMVIDGIRAANEAGLKPVKVNVVVMRGRNEDEVADFLDFSEREDVVVRFIEYMPFMKGQDWDELFVPRDEIIEKLGSRIEPLNGKTPDPRAPARYYSIRGTSRHIGFISPVSHGFCSVCNRLRLTPDGRLLACLLSPTGIDLKTMLRNGATDEELADAFRGAAAAKGPKGKFPDATRLMHTVGG